MAWNVDAWLFSDTGAFMVCVNLASNLATEPTEAQLIGFGNTLKSNLLTNLLGTDKIKDFTPPPNDVAPLQVEGSPKIWVHKEKISYFLVNKYQYPLVTP